MVNNYWGLYHQELIEEIDIKNIVKYKVKPRGTNTNIPVKKQFSIWLKLMIFFLNFLIIK